MNLEDKLYLLGQLEHLRQHSLRASKTCTEQEDKFFWQVTAAQAQSSRRKLQHSLGEIATEDWCPVKVAQDIRRLNYETMEGDVELFEELESLVDSINSHVFKQDMTGCFSCKTDMLATKEEV